MDVRTVALFRVGLALLVLFDLIFRSRYIRAHYTSFGMKAPGQLDHKFAEWGLSWIPHTIDSFPFQVGFFLVFGLVALCLLFGLHTRLASVATWLLLLALHTQNTNIMQGGDLFLRMLLFWGMFLPLGACFSIDSALNSSPKKIPDRIVSAGTLGLLLQVCFVYWFTAAFKTSAIWWEEGTAIYYALNIDQFATPLGHFLLGFPELLRVLSFATIWWEVVGPILVFIPVFTGPIRAATVFLFIGFHLGLGFSLELGPFPYICSVAWTAFLPSWFWDKIFHWLRTPARLGLKIYYDGDCGFCKKTVLLIRTRLGGPIGPIPRRPT